MISPYAIQGPAIISLSGGRTSAFMLRQILDAHGGQLPANIHVAFANTGKELEETLVFVREIERRWGVKVHLLEWRDDGPGFAEVEFHSASRKGEPFAKLIWKKRYLPNWQARFCTEFLKVRVLQAFAKSLGYKLYREVVGLRHDEGLRLLKMYARADKDFRFMSAPMDAARVTRQDVLRFWLGPTMKVGDALPQGFDLGLEPWEGNCDNCFMKARGNRVAMIHKRPGSGDWWGEMEDLTGGFFDRRTQYSALIAEAKAKRDLRVMSADEHDAECGVTCGGPSA